MPPAFNWRDPILINTIGHAAGLLLFSFTIALLLRGRRGLAATTQTKLSLAAAALALAWNVGSLIALALPNSRAVAPIMAVSFSVLSLLPAILLQLAMKQQHPAIVQIGYALSACAICLHLSELVSTNPIPHQLALILCAVGFGLLTLAAFLQTRRQGVERFSLTGLFLFTTSFPHFGYQHTASPWAAEIAWHHIGIPVALLVILSDYRFLLLDTFIRFLMNSLLASGYLTCLFLLNLRFSLWKHFASSMFFAGLSLTALCLSLILFADLRNRLQRWIGQAIFRRQNLDDRIRRVNQWSSQARSEEELLTGAAAEVGAHVRSHQFAIVPQPSPELTWAEAQIPLSFSSGEIHFLLTGARAGRQRYLSEDLGDMRRIAAAIVEGVERFRSAELRRLAAGAELRALQAQINPHFLFNALNTLYGAIDRTSHEARRTVLNLAEIFRYLLQDDRTFIALSEELRIVTAYLEIEALRLGDRLQTEVIVSEAARSVMIPVLSIQPLVENAVKHGVAAKPEGGRVSLHANIIAGKLHVTVADTGAGFGSHPSADGAGIGLDNVRRRLALSYGADSSFQISSSAEGSTVAFQIPEAEVPCAR